jgi:transcriptional regulator with XRE-family HTH domain
MELVIARTNIMNLTSAQAKRLGTVIASARVRKGLSVRGLAAELGIKPTWLAELEAGHYLDPAPDRLAQLAEALDLKPSRIDRLTKGGASEGLPELHTYFRAKYDLSPEEIDKVERYIERLRRAA